MKRTGFLLVAFLGAAFFPSFGMATFLGPYSGTVTDSQTDEPVAGASVLLYSEKKVFAPPEGYSEVIRASLVYTDKAGSYHIPRALASLGLLASLDRTGIVIYQPGYQAYIKFKWHRERERKSEAAFRETGNIVKLDRVPPKFHYGTQYRKLEDALQPLRDRDGAWTDPESGRLRPWKKRKEILLRSGIVEADELLRRAEWEK